MGQKGVRNTTELYELMLVVNPSLLEKERKEVLDRWTDYLKENGAEIKEEYDGGLRDLAYKIKDKYKGYYFGVYFIANRDIIKSLNDKLKIEKEVLRFLVSNLKKDFTLEAREAAEARVINSFAYDEAKKAADSTEMVADDDEMDDAKPKKETTEKVEEKKEEAPAKVKKAVVKKVAAKASMDELDAKIDDLIDNI